jgi:hypothetical protein
MDNDDEGYEGEEMMKGKGLGGRSFLKWSAGPAGEVEWTPQRIPRLVVNATQSFAPPRNRYE